jgi:hypothetical protein
VLVGRSGRGLHSTTPAAPPFPVADAAAAALVFASATLQLIGLAGLPFVPSIA